MKIKKYIRFCSCKGCRKNMILILNLRQEVREKKFKLCEEHTKELMRIGKLKSVTFEETINVE